VGFQHDRERVSKGRSERWVSNSCAGGVCGKGECGAACAEREQSAEQQRWRSKEGENGCSQRMEEDGGGGGPKINDNFFNRHSDILWAALRTVTAP
jgi:hypothetical protein